ncbi:hypothetical protein [Cryptosporangium aurantiacum]|nr:hypothetical protein [Cryptosporangium aurantiacum]
MAIVYGLFDPRTDALRYIGRTTGTLAARLAGHRGHPPSPAMRRWLDDLRAAGLVPRITPLRDNVPAEELADAELTAIAEHALAGADLLNEAGVATALCALREQRRAAQRTAGWRRLAEELRSAGAGLAAPWPVDYALSPKTWDVVHTLATRPVDSSRYSEEVQRTFRYSEICDWLLRDARPALPPVHHDADLHEEINTCVAGAYEALTAPTPDAVAAYISAVPWLRIVVAPWRGLAQYAGLPHEGSEFASWVTGDPSIQEQLIRLDAVASPLAKRPTRPRGDELDPGGGAGRARGRLRRAALIPLGRAAGHSTPAIGSTFPRSASRMYR